VKYFHRTHLAPDVVLAEAATWFGGRLAPTAEEPRRRRYGGSLGSVTVDARPDGGHATMVTLATDQPGESELDKFAKRFLTVLHGLAEPRHVARGAY